MVFLPVGVVTLMVLAVVEGGSEGSAAQSQ